MAAGKEQRQQRARDVVGTLVGEAPVRPNGVRKAVGPSFAFRQPFPAFTLDLARC
jgi:hypothetical protein